MKRFVILLAAVMSLAGFWRIAAAQTAPVPRPDERAVGQFGAGAAARAAQNGRAASEALERSDRLMRDWLTLADSSSGLLPRNTTDSRDIWNAKDTAADLYPFLVLTAWFTDHELFAGRMQDLLMTETALTSRVGRLPDTYSFSKQGFATEQPDLPSIMFGSAEYAKDALMNITEWLGASPWRARMLGLVDDAWRLAPVETPYGRIVSTDPEVNGDMLLVLGRIYWMTRDPKYLEYAIRLGDYYLLGERHPTRDFETLRLRDHGNEIVSGLTELYATVKQANPHKAVAYQAPLHAMLDRILEVGRNEDGLFYNVIDPRAGKPTNTGIADNFGYVLNGLYTVYLLDGTPAYRDAVRKALGSLNARYRGYNWENLGQDGDADAIEGALYLLNREPDSSAAEWIDYQTRWMWSKQDSAHRPNTERWRGRGIVEGGYADGNFNRTSLMYALWKTAGTSAHPWRRDVRVGAVREAGAVLLNIVADSAWAGELRFDVPRHRLYLGMPVDWPRINSYPEWFTVEPAKVYEVRDEATGARSEHTGAELQRGWRLRLAPGEQRWLSLRPLTAGARGAAAR
ncbi:MAG: hypothetical protein KY464_14265 [Gemmatimonadetes bacterium]|nr:hypothetical protein [Gemmatimonadota bacterium]